MLNRSATANAYGNASVMAMNTAIVWLLPLHGIVVIGQFAAGICGAFTTGLLCAAARRIERAEKASTR